MKSRLLVNVGAVMVCLAVGLGAPVSYAKPQVFGHRAPPPSTGGDPGSSTPPPTTTNSGRHHHNRLRQSLPSAGPVSGMSSLGRTSGGRHHHGTTDPGPTTPPTTPPTSSCPPTDGGSTGDGGTCVIVGDPGCGNTDPPTRVAAPEPNTLPLIALALGALGWVTWRGKRASARRILR